jgi:hypothetical protein
MDASAIVQNDGSIENMRAMTEATLEHGVYSRGRLPAPASPKPAAQTIGRPTRTPPGSVEPWDRVKANWPEVNGNEPLVRRIWAQTDGLAYMYAWHVVESF